MELFRGGPLHLDGRSSAESDPGGSEYVDMEPGSIERLKSTNIVAGGKSIAGSISRLTETIDLGENDISHKRF